MDDGQSKPPEQASVPEERRASEYLANERTFLAWIRTSIAVIGFGFVISRFAIWVRLMGVEPKAPEDHLSMSSIMAVVMMVFGAVLAILAVWRYHAVNRAIDEGRVRADRGLVILVTVIVVLLALGGVVGFMISGH